MDKAECCKDCRYAERSGTGGFYCHLHAPTRDLIIVTDGFHSRQGAAVWPYVDADDWCGEFGARKPNE